MVGIETRRLISQLRFRVALCLMLGLSIMKVYSELSFTAGGAHVQGALSMAAADWLPNVIPLAVGLVAAGSLAADRRRGYVPLVLARGISRRQYLLAKGVAMACASALVMLVGCLIFLAVAFVTLPNGQMVITDGVGVNAAGDRVVIPAVEYYPGPMPLLYSYSPILNDVLSILMVMTGAAALALTGLLVGVLTTNEYIAAAVPFVLIFVSLFVFFNRADAISPYTYVDVWNQYRRLPISVSGYAAFVYWSVFGVVLYCLADAIFIRRELN